MVEYALLLQAGASRVYEQGAVALAAAELADVAVGALSAPFVGLEPRRLGDVEYLVASRDGPLTPAELEVVANLSSLQALFELEGDRLRPLPRRRRMVVDDDLLTIQRYQGKTNEAFTHLLVNLALARADRGFERLLAGERLTLLDPVCGRGTTLNRAIAYGMDAVGVEADSRDVAAYEVFLGTWLKDKRFKHDVERARLRKGRAQPAMRLEIDYGRKGEPERRRVTTIQDDTTNTAEHVKVRSVDLLVADLPYGVQHGAHDRDGGLDRSPGGLVAAALPGWVSTLRTGGGVTLAWNRRTLPRPELVAALHDAGLAVARPDDDRYVHRVDRSITRDLVVAALPAG